MIPERLPTPPEIAQDPELAVLAALDTVLHLALCALVAARLDFNGDGESGQPREPLARAALRVARHAGPLHRALRLYFTLARSRPRPQDPGDVPF